MWFPTVTFIVFLQVIVAFGQQAFVIKNKKTGKVLNVENHICKMTEWSNKSSQIWSLETTNETGSYMLRNMGNKEHLRYIRDYSYYDVWKLNTSRDTQIQIENFNLLLADKLGNAEYIFEEPDDDTDRWFLVDPKFMSLQKPVSNAQDKIFVIKNKKTGEILEVEDHNCKMSDWKNKTSQMWTLEDTNQTGHFQIRNVENKEYLRYFQDQSDYTIWKLNIQGDTQIQMEDFDLLLADKDGTPKYIFEEPDDDTNRWFFIDPKFMTLIKPLPNQQGKQFVIKNKKTGNILEVEDHNCKIADWKNKTSQMWTLEDTNQTGHFKIRNMENKEYLRYIRDYSDYNIWKLNIQGDTQIQIEDFDLLLADKDGKAKYIFEEPDDDTDRWFFIDPKFMTLIKPVSNQQGKQFVIKNKKTGNILDVENHKCKIADWNNKNSQMWTLEDTNQTGHFKIRNVENKEYLRYIRDYSDYNIWKLNIQGDTQIQIEEFDLLLADKDGKANYIFEEPDDDTDRWFFIDPQFMKVPKPFSNAQSKIFVIKNKKTEKILEVEDHNCKMADWNNNTSQMWTLEDTNQTGHFRIKNVENKEYLRYVQNYSDYNVWKVNVQGDTQIQIEDVGLLLADKDGKAKYIFEEPDDGTDRWLFVEPMLMKIPKPLSNQQGKRFVIKNKKTGKILDLEDHNCKMTDWNNKTSQMWTLQDTNQTGHFQIRNVENKEYLRYLQDYSDYNVWKLDIQGDTQIQIEDFDLLLADKDGKAKYIFEEPNDDTDRWLFVEPKFMELPKPISNDSGKRFVIKNKKTGKVLDVKDHKYRMTDWNNKPSQLWTLEDTNQTGYFIIRNEDNEWYLTYYYDYPNNKWKLDIPDDTQIQMENIDLFLVNEDDEGKYSFEKIDDKINRWFFIEPRIRTLPEIVSSEHVKKFVIQNKKTGKVLDMKDDKYKMTDWNNKPSQLWTLEDTNQTGYFIIRNVDNKEYLRYSRDNINYNIWKTNIQDDTQIQIEYFGLLLVDENGEPNFVFQDPSDEIDRWFFVDPKFMPLPESLSNEQSKRIVIRNKKTGMVLDLEDHSYKMNEWNNKPSQIWTLKDTNQTRQYIFSNTDNREYLRCYYDYINNIWKMNIGGNSHIEMEDFDLLLADKDGDGQYIFEKLDGKTDLWFFIEPKFRIIPKPISNEQGKIFALINPKTGKFLDTESDIYKMTEWKNETSQMWTLEPTENQKYFMLRDMENREFLGYWKNHIIYEKLKTDTKKIQFDGDHDIVLADIDGVARFISGKGEEENNKWLLIEIELMRNIVKPKSIYVETPVNQFVIENKRTGMVLDGENTIQLEEWSNKNSQLWTLEPQNNSGRFLIRNVATRAVLTQVKDGVEHLLWKVNPNNDTLIQVQDPEGFLIYENDELVITNEMPNDDQGKWKFVEQTKMIAKKPKSIYIQKPPKKFVIENKKTGLVLDGYQKHLKLTDYAAKDSQLWTLKEHNQSGYYAIQNVANGALVAYDKDSTQYHFWKLKTAGDTYIEMPEQDISLSQRFRDLVYSPINHDDEDGIWLFLDPSELNTTNIKSIYVNKEEMKFAIESKDTGMVLDVSQNVLKLNNWEDSDDQLWFLEPQNKSGHYLIRNVAGRGILTYPGSTTEYQIWKLDTSSETWIQIEDSDIFLAHKRDSVTYTGSKQSDGSDKWYLVEQKSMKGRIKPKPIYVAAPRIEYVIENKRSGLVLDAAQALALEEWENKDSQLWLLEPQKKSGHYFIRNVENRGVLSYPRNGTEHQTWKLNINNETYIQAEDVDIFLAQSYGRAIYSDVKRNDETDRWIFVEKSKKTDLKPKPIHVQNENDLQLFGEVTSV